MQNAEGAGAAADLEAEVSCVPKGAVIGGEASSGGVRCRCCIGLVRRSGGNMVICFCISV